MNILIINSGSSSVKFQVINIENEEVKVKGHVDEIGLDSCLFKLNGDSKKTFVKNHDEAISMVLDTINDLNISGVGHRFVHGGIEYDDSVIVDDEVLKKLEHLNDLAPLHNPHNLQGIKACKRLLNVPQVAVFDTSFHKTLVPETKHYALPRDVAEKHSIRRFGFHGLSHNYLLLETKKILEKNDLNIITCHLGNGCSISCIKNSICTDTSMGFTPMQGLVMGSRSGDVDPGAVLFLQKKLGISAEETNTLLNKQSGLKGICGDSDMRLIYRRSLNNDEDAAFALNMFCYRITHYVSAYLGLMKSDTDALVFSAGIGEGAFYVRKQVCDSLKHLGIIINDEKNMINNGLITSPTIISSESSKIKVLVIPTNEELMIAKETHKLI